MRAVLAGIGIALLSTSALAQVAKEQLEQPPASAQHFVIESTGGKHGDSWIWRTADGVWHGRESMNLRGQVWEMDSQGSAGPDGLPANLTVDRKSVV